MGPGTTPVWMVHHWLPPDLQYRRSTRRRHYIQSCTWLLCTFYRLLLNVSWGIPSICFVWYTASSLFLVFVTACTLFIVLELCPELFSFMLCVCIVRHCLLPCRVLHCIPSYYSDGTFCLMSSMSGYAWLLFVLSETAGVPFLVYMICLSVITSGKYFSCFWWCTNALRIIKEKASIVKKSL